MRRQASNPVVIDPSGSRRWTDPSMAPRDRGNSKEAASCTSRNRSRWLRSRIVHQSSDRRHSGQSPSIQTSNAGVVGARFIVCDNEEWGFGIRLTSRKKILK